MVGQIIKVSGGSITEIANKNYTLIGKNIHTIAALQVNETAENGIFFK